MLYLFQGKAFGFFLSSISVAQFSISRRSGHHTIEMQRENKGFSLHRGGDIELERLLYFLPSVIVVVIGRGINFMAT
jgi:hypothetical protein